VIEGIGIAPLVLLALWGGVVGIDLVSVPQFMVSRPLVVGIVAGAIVGDPMAGLRVGLVLELFALDVLPVGAARYPDYGAATIGAVLIVAGGSWVSGVGLGVATGLLIAALGGWTMPVLRRANAAAITRRLDGLQAGDSATIRSLQLAGLGRDALRSGLLVMAAIGAALLIRRLPPLGEEPAFALTVAVIGAGLASALAGGMRTAGRSVRLRWLVAGLATGITVALAW
jgi:PTS system mannose-specific IIC component